MRSAGCLPKELNQAPGPARPMPNLEHLVDFEEALDDWQ